MTVRGRPLSGRVIYGVLNTTNINKKLLQIPEQGEDLPLPDDIHKWHYVSLK